MSNYLGKRGCHQSAHHEDCTLVGITLLEAAARATTIGFNRLSMERVCGGRGGWLLMVAVVVDGSSGS